AATFLNGQPIGSRININPRRFFSLHSILHATSGSEHRNHPFIRRARNRPKASLIPINNLALTTIFNVDHRAGTFTVQEATAGHRERHHRHTRGLQCSQLHGAHTFP
ncbi:hypothetical protein B0H13DRAFT_2669628, partial [Mycena leptocephala]